MRDYTDYVELAPGPVRRREPAWPGVVLVIGLGPELRLSDPARPHCGATRQTSFLAGIGERWTVTEHDGVQQGVQVNLTPPAARLLLRAPMHELANHVVSLEDALGRDAERLAARLAAAGPDERVRILDAELAARLLSGEPMPPEVRQAWRRLVESGGSIRVDALADETGWSRRHLTARFRDYVGVPPKTLARLVRFDRARRQVEAGRALADVAYACGYADQAHMNRSFRDFAGCPPTELLARRLPGGGGIGDGPLPSVQDAARLAA